MTNVGIKHFCYDNFTKGDIVVVASTTYKLGLSEEIPDTYISLNHSLQLSENKHCLIIRGEKLPDTRIKVDLGGGYRQNTIRYGDLRKKPISMLSFMYLMDLMI
jgi:hypothetical protein